MTGSSQTTKSAVRRPGRGRALIAALVPLLMAACITGEATTEAPGSATTLLLVNGSPGDVSVWADATPVVTELGASLSQRFEIPADAQVIRLESGNGAVTNISTNVAANGRITLGLFGGPSGSVSAVVVPDTGSLPVAGRSKVRVVNLAPSATSVDIWRTQPDFQSATRVMFPFPYLASSSFLQSDPGSWTVWVTSTTSTTVLATTGPFTVGGGELRTVALVDSSGVLRLRVISE